MTSSLLQLFKFDAGQTNRTAQEYLRVQSDSDLLINCGIALLISQDSSFSHLLATDVFYN